MVELEWITKLRKELMLAPMKSNFTFTRDEVLALLAAPPATPAATWRVNGEPDPHDNHYDCERAALCMGGLTDDELANAAFMNYDRNPSVQDMIEGRAFRPIVYMTAVKERIRWLSRALEKAKATVSVNTSQQSETEISQPVKGENDS